MTARLGGAHTTFVHPYSNQIEPRIGLWAGVGIRIRLSGPADGLVGVDYTQKGAFIDRGDVGYRTRVSYVELPILIRLRGPGIGPASPHLIAGGAVSVVARCASTRVVLWLGDGETPVSCEEADVTAVRVGLTGIVGAGIRIELFDSTAISFDALYSRGRHEIEHSDLATRNRVFGLVAGLEWTRD